MIFISIVNHMQAGRPLSTIWLIISPTFFPFHPKFSQIFWSGVQIFKNASVFISIAIILDFKSLKFLWTSSSSWFWNKELVVDCLSSPSSYRPRGLTWTRGCRAKQETNVERTTYIGTLSSPLYLRSMAPLRSC